MAFEITAGKKSLRIDRKGVHLVDVDYSNHRMMYQVTNVDDFLNVVTGAYSDQNLIELFHSVAEVFAPIHTIAFRVSGGKFQLKRKKDDEVVYDNKVMNRLLSQPNPLQTFQELLYEAVVYEYVTGKNYLFANIPDTLPRDYKYVSALWNLWADRVQIVVPPRAKLFSATTITDIIDGYRIPEVDDKPFPADRVLYTKALNIEQRGLKIKGKSPLTAAAKPMANIVAVYSARHAIYVKRGALGALVSKKSDADGNVALTPKEKQMVKDDLNTKGFGRNQELLEVTDQPVEFVRFGMSITELEPFKETEADTIAIGAVLGVDKDLLPLAEGTTFENKQKAERGLYRNVVIPLAERICQAWTNFLGLDVNGYYLAVDFSHVEALQEDAAKNATTAKTNSETFLQQYEKGLITKNMALIGMGHEAIKAGGDIYIYEAKNDAPLAVTLGVGGTQALQSVLADATMAEDTKRNVLQIMFGVSPEQAAQMVTPAVTNNAKPKPEEDETAA